MTEQEKAALVEIATKRLAQYRKMQEHQNSDVRPRGGIDFKYEPSIALMEIALAALTAEPVGDFYEDGKDNWWQIGPHDKVPHVTPLYTAPPAPAIPDGWRLVPVEPTDAMTESGWDKLNVSGDMNCAYEAMIAAAPTP